MANTVTNISFSEAEVGSITVKLPSRSAIHERSLEPLPTQRGMNEPHPIAPEKGKNFPIHGSFKSLESYKQNLGSLRPVMSLERFESLTTKREPAAMTHPVLVLRGEHNKAIVLNNVPYADDHTIQLFEGQRLPRGIHRVEITQNGRPQVLFLTSIQFKQAKGAHGVTIY